MFKLRLMLAMLSLLTLGGLAGAQTFTVSQTFVTATKPASFFVFYNYVQLENLTNDTLHLRWVKTETLVNPGAGHGSSSEMGSWVTSILDPNNSYDPANAIDSADFYLLPEASSTDKFIFHLFPNLQAGNLVVKFKIFPVDDPADAQFVTFDFTATPVATGTEELTSDQQLAVYPNPAGSDFTLSNLSETEKQIWLADAQGRVLESFLLKKNETRQVSCEGLPSGVFYLKFQQGQQFGWQKLIISR